MDKSARERFIEATTRLIEMHGYHGTGLNQIIKEGGAPRGSLYHHFPNGKEELVSEAIDKLGQGVADQTRKILDSANSLSDGVYSIFLYLSKKFDDSDCVIAGSIASVALETSHISEKLRETCKRTYDSWRSAYEEMLLESGFSASRAAQISTFITASIDGAIILCRINRSSEPLMHIAREIKFLLEHTRDLE
ncbi:TetR/AcrR family transcriptional regulator [Paenibacillus harenae]|uniref:TetR/AcrR family transcriptional repressor of lmrAB and yxaGH operons n=1 Tax=Paenibacillus harenae TaxID=306543 RepID=A0ABT9U2I4_PAEHA|nr:TetR/AcrR family transcriptional regulator [Paenibacillus harenae]MDQ0113837.1 TetR/AcrR family transcriptional repressor of lmrAB and yxaGH operons [Paenibacillus harenae]